MNFVGQKTVKISYRSKIAMGMFYRGERTTTEQEK
jgi:hypothetical protein